MSQPARFRDGASYDLMMGPWSRAVGEIFLDAIAPSADLDWVDVGCGSGAFTALIGERCAPRSIVGVDPSAAQLDFARSRNLPNTRFEEGDGSALPLADRSVDVAAAALVLHFMPDPAIGVAEMARVTKPGGIVAAYVWDLAGGGFPYEALLDAMREVGMPPAQPPSPEAGEAAGLHRLWVDAGLDIAGEREITVSRTFPSFDAYWEMATAAPRTAIVLEKAPVATVAQLKKLTRTALPSDTSGVVAPTARANAIWGRVR